MVVKCSGRSRNMLIVVASPLVGDLVVAYEPGTLYTMMMQHYYYYQQ